MKMLFGEDVVHGTYAGVAMGVTTGVSGISKSPYGLLRQKVSPTKRSILLFTVSKQSQMYVAFQYLHNSLMFAFQDLSRTEVILASKAIDAQVSFC